MGSSSTCIFVKTVRNQANGLNFCLLILEINWFMFDVLACRLGLFDGIDVFLQ